MRAGARIEYKGRRTGTLGDAAAFSFYPGKCWELLAMVERW